MDGIGCVRTHIPVTLNIEMNCTTQEHLKLLLPRQNQNCLPVTCL